MEFPTPVRLAIEQNAIGKKQKELIQLSKQMTRKYQEESGQGKVLVSKKDEATVYSIVRMPATFQAVDAILTDLKAISDFDFESLIDVGSGTGAASLACFMHYPFKISYALEREKAMRDLGKRLLDSMAFGPKINWQAFDLTKDTLTLQADCVIESYMLNEFNDQDLYHSLDQLYQASKQVLILVEPGTKKGFALLKKVRHYLIEKGGYILAPCGCNRLCELNDEDWCHFSQRVARSKLHKIVKEADVPYEDEKYSYLVVSKENINCNYARILRHPYITKGRIDVEYCYQGKINSKVFMKKDALYKQIRKKNWGNQIEL